MSENTYLYGYFFVISGASAVGKTTLIHCMQKFFPEIIQSISYTTRSPRNNEIPNRHYFFINDYDFRIKIKKNKFLEYRKFNNYWYGTSKKPLFRFLNSGKNIFITLDTKSAYSLKKKYPENVILIFLQTSYLSNLEKRLKNRNLPQKDIEARLKTNEVELINSYNYDYRILMDDFSEALGKMILIYKFHTQQI